MTVLLDREFPRTRDELLARFANAVHRGARIEAWLFESEAARRDAERQLAACGVRARIRSAYKPLIHFFLEEAEGPFDAVTVHVPTHADAVAERFRLEAFPLAGLIGSAALRFLPGESALEYRILLERGGSTSEHRVFAPNHVREDHLGAQVLSPTGWLRVWRNGQDGPPDEDGPLVTEYESLFAAAIDAVVAQQWPATMPFFDVLAIDARVPGMEQRVAWQDECMSTVEGLHEDLYFSLLEIFQRHSGLRLGDRTLQPGQIVPDIRMVDGPAHLRVALEAAPPVRASAPEPLDWDEAGKPPPPGQIEAALAELGGAPIATRSRQGRTVAGRFIDGAGRGLVITGGQHANETTGVVGAMRAARRLREIGARFAVIPQENADGYALHARLRESNPRHMHHAARYTALGDDLQYRSKEPLYEKAARLEAFRRTDAGLHINLHGYPAHEWTRPLTGYIPRGFERWTMPQGFYLILHHPAGRREHAVAFLQALTAQVARVPGLRALNERQIAAWTAHAGRTPDPIYNGICCIIGESDAFPVPYSLVTEYPDETIYDDAFRLGHAVQMTTVLEAAALYRDGMLPTG